VRANRPRQIYTQAVKDRVEAWMLKEFNAIQKGDERVMNCPFCDDNENHKDYSFNIEKMAGKCWRGFSSECESGHSLISFVALYFNISFDKAAEFVNKNFDTDNSVLKFKRRLKDFLNQADYMKIANEPVIWDMPSNVKSIYDPQSHLAQRAMDWLILRRRVPEDVIKLLEPKVLENALHKRWRRYVDRVFFPVTSCGNEGWIAYSMAKKSTKECPKTMNPPGPILSSMLYLYDFYTRDNSPIILCEGIFDSIRLFTFGFNSVTLFGTNISAAQIDLLNQLNPPEVIVCLDEDATTLKLNKKGKWSSKAYKLARVLCKSFFGDVSVMRLEKGDPDELTYKQAKVVFDDRKKFDNPFSKVRKLSIALA